MACKCYHAERNFLGKIGVCWGTKECEACSCGGDESKCDFYEDKRKNVTPRSTNMIDKDLMEYYNTEITDIIRQSVQTLRINFDKMASDATQTLYTTVPMNRYPHDPAVFAEAYTKIPVIDHYVYIAEILHEFELNVDQYIDRIYHSIYAVDSKE